jgi:hypothetical protein
MYLDLFRAGVNCSLKFPDIVIYRATDVLVEDLDMQDSI